MGFTDLPFDDAIHKATIDIDEEGSVATAATAIIVSRGGGNKIDEFFCDHPFIFMINDRVSHEILFTGVYRGPAAAEQ